MDQDNSNFGGGSGGGGVVPAPPPLQPTPALKQTDSHSIDGSYSYKANQMEFRAQPPQLPAPPDPCKILMFAADTPGAQGEVNFRGAKGVRATTGPPPLPKIENSGIMGFEVETCDIHKIKLTRGVTPPNIQLVTMDPTAGILIDGAPMPVKVNSKTQIEMDVTPAKVTMTPASIKLELGPCSISITPTGITLAMAANSIAISATGITITGLPAVNIN